MRFYFYIQVVRLFLELLLVLEVLEVLVDQLALVLQESLYLLLLLHVLASLEDLEVPILRLSLAFLDFQVYLEGPIFNVILNFY